MNSSSKVTGIVAVSNAVPKTFAPNFGLDSHRNPFIVNGVLRRDRSLAATRMDAWKQKQKKPNSHGKHREKLLLGFDFVSFERSMNSPHDLFD